jgi:hypothetical protein
VLRHFGGAKVTHFWGFIVCECAVPGEVWGEVKVVVFD